jgi:hypothetical protein
MILPALSKGGYSYKKQQKVGSRPGGGAHKIDLLVEDSKKKKILVSLKWQQTQGTAEQKIPFEVISLLEAIKTENAFDKAYLVLGGEGWTLRDYYVREELEKYIHYSPCVRIVTLEKFIALANEGKL